MKRTFRIRIGIYGVAVCALGMLIWARLMLVTRPPRVAIAQPTPAQLELSGVRTTPGPAPVVAPAPAPAPAPVAH